MVKIKKGEKPSMITEKKAKAICELVFDKQRRINANNKIIREKSYQYISEGINAEDRNSILNSEIVAIFDTVTALEPNAEIITVWNKETNDELGVCINGKIYYMEGVTA